MWPIHLKMYREGDAMFLQVIKDRNTTTILESKLTKVNTILVKCHWGRYYKKYGLCSSPFNGNTKVYFAEHCHWNSQNVAGNSFVSFLHDMGDFNENSWMIPDPAIPIKQLVNEQQNPPPSFPLSGSDLILPASGKSCGHFYNPRFRPTNQKNGWRKHKTT